MLEEIILLFTERLAPCAVNLAAWVLDSLGAGRGDERSVDCLLVERFLVLPVA